MVHTGRITSSVRASAIPVRILFGGLCCNPSAWRKIASTIIKRVKQVIISIMTGSRPSRVIMIRISILTL
ncbi:hypothetical protein D3C85_1419710 [compost metagenome]